MYFPGCGVQIQEMLGLPTIGALDVRNQCSGFGLCAIGCRSVYKKQECIKNILVIGSEFHSGGLDVNHTWKGSFL